MPDHENTQNEAGAAPCSPARLDQDFQALEDSAREALAVIVARRRALDEQGRGKEPLIIVAGEDHTAPAHKIFHLMLLKELRQARLEPMVTYEQEHNHLAARFIQNRPYAHSDMTRTIMNKDRNGILSLVAKMADKSHPPAPVASALVDFYLLASRYAAFPVDAAIEYDFLDMDDRATYESAVHCLGAAAAQKKPNIDCCDPDGVYIRNENMVSMTLDLALRGNRRIIFQRTGNEHVLGSNGDCPGAQSLAALYKQRNVAVLAMPGLSRAYTESYMGTGHGLTQDEIFCARDLPPVSAFYDPYSYPPGADDEPPEGLQVDISTMADEIAYVNGLIARTGLMQFKASEELFWEQKQDMNKTLRRQFAGWERSLTLNPRQKSIVPPCPAQLHIDRDAAQILRVATKAAKEILSKRAVMDQQGRHDQTLYVLGGEHHGTPAHRVYHMLVLNQLQQAEPKLIAGYEHGHNQLNFLARAFNGHKKVSSLPPALLKKRDPQGKLLLTAFSTAATGSSSPYSKFILFNFLLKNNIRTRFTDTSLIETDMGAVLDSYDSSTAASLKACGLPGEGQIIYSYLEEGLKARNHHMVEKLTRFAGRTGARIAYQQCGVDHVTHSVSADFNRQHSLPALLIKKNAAFIAAGPGIAQYNGTLSDTLPTAMYRPLSAQESGDSFDGDTKADIRCLESEVNYMNGLLSRTGLKDYGLSTDEYWQKKEDFHQISEKRFRKWERHALKT